MRNDTGMTARLVMNKSAVVGIHLQSEGRSETEDIVRSIGAAHLRNSYRASRSKLKMKFCSKCVEIDTQSIWNPDMRERIILHFGDEQVTGGQYEEIRSLLRPKKQRTVLPTKINFCPGAYISGLETDPRDCESGAYLRSEFSR